MAQGRSAASSIHQEVVKVSAAKSNREKQRDHYERMKAAGMKKVCVYVPAPKVKQLRDFAAKLRESD